MTKMTVSCGRNGEYYLMVTEMTKEEAKDLIAGIGNARIPDDRPISVAFGNFKGMLFDVVAEKALR